MAEIIKGDTTKGIKSVGELALRISRFDSYRLFTLYENVNEKKVMNLSGKQKYYLVFRSSNKEIRIPEYDPMGYFEVDKVNGCVLFKITKKNAEDILSMRTAGERIFHIIRVFEETDAFGKVLSVTDEVEVYNGRWGDDTAFNTFNTENKVDLLTKALAAQIDKNANQLTEYKDLLEKYNAAVGKSSDLEKELEAMRAERDSLEAQLNEYVGSTYDGTLLSTDTKYIAFENTLDNISFTEDQYSNAMNELMTKGEVDLANYDLDTPRINLDVRVYDGKLNNLKINVYKQDNSIGSAAYGQNLANKIVDADSGDIFKFECIGANVSSSSPSKVMYLRFEPSANMPDFNAVKISTSNVIVNKTTGKAVMTATIQYTYKDKDGNTINIDAVGNIGTLRCYVQ